MLLVGLLAAVATATAVLPNDKRRAAGWNGYPYQLKNLRNRQYD